MKNGVVKDWEAVLSLLLPGNSEENT